MKSFVKYSVRVILMALAAVCILFILIVTAGGGAFSHTYQSVIQDKYDFLRKTESPRIIIVGGSSAAYGIDERLLEQETGKTVVNLGLYGGLGNLFQTQLLKGNIGSGDIIVLAYEYNWIDSDSFEALISDMVMSGIDGRIDMYRYIPLRNWPQVIGYLPDFLVKKIQYTKAPGEDVHHTLFDAEGRLTQKRDEWIAGDYFENEAVQNPVDLSDKEISTESADYLRRLAAYADREGALICMAAPPLLDLAAEGDAASFDAFAQRAQETTGIPYISTPSEYIYPIDLMYDTVYHCNDRGAKQRTLQLAEDLKKLD